MLRLICKLFYIVQSANRTFTLGANVTLSDLIELFIKEAAKSGNTGAYNELKKYMYRIASSPIRNVGTIYDKTVFCLFFFFFFFFF